MNFHKGGDGQPRGFGFGGFTLAKKESSGSNQQGKFGPTGGYGGISGYTWKHRSEEDYFEDDDDATDRPSIPDDLEYLPAPDSPVMNPGADDDDDPLDAYMAEIDAEAEKQKEKVREIEAAGNAAEAETKGKRADIEEEDAHESYFRYMEENPMAGVIVTWDEGNEIEYDEDGNPIIPEKSKVIDPLPPIDHSAIEYKSFERNFYFEHEDMANLSAAEVDQLRKRLNVKVSGPSPPKPCSSFAHFGFDNQLMHAIRKSEYAQPTPIQAQAIPAALGGRDIIGIAKTGSGKTAAYLWPLLVHIMDQPELKEGDGPVGLILAPTRELSQQIYTEAKRFGKVYNIQVVCCYGGGSKYEQCKAAESGCEIMVATPGRLIDIIKSKATNLQRVTYLVIDEADRMFDMGFEPQVRSIANHVRPDRQTMLFSATFKRKVEKLARDILLDPVRIVQGELGEASEDVMQIVKIFETPPEKWKWITSRLVEFTTRGSVLIFVTKKQNSEELSNNLKMQDFKAGLLHGDMSQIERNETIHDFRKNKFPILVATDVAARGLDILSIKTVINYDVARDIDTHTHRIGRTGRAGEKGTAYTLMTPKDKEFAGHLVRNLEGANQAVPDELMSLAMQVQWFKKSRFRQGKGKRVTTGLGFKSRPGLGSADSGSYKVGTYGSGSKSGSTGGVWGASGPQSERMASMKAIFQNQYKSHFQKASTETEWKGGHETPMQAGNTSNYQLPAESHSAYKKAFHSSGTVPAPSVGMPPPPAPVPPSSSNKDSAKRASSPTSTKRVKKSRWDS